MSLLIGLFVGGQGRRFGGTAKGRLPIEPGGTLIERLIGVCRAALPEATLSLVGRAEAYADLGLPVLADAPAGIGPLGGLHALLLQAEEQRASAALALACDLPFLSPSLLLRLASEQPLADALAPRHADRWYALSARYSIRALPAVEAVIASNRYALQNVFDELASRAGELAVDAAELGALRDWDEPADLTD